MPATHFQPDPVPEAKQRLDIFLNSGSVLPQNEIAGVKNAFDQLPTQEKMIYLKKILVRLQKAEEGKAGPSLYQQINGVLEHAINTVQQLKQQLVTANGSHA